MRLQRLRGGAEVAKSGFWGWIQALRRLLFPGNPERKRSALPMPEPKPKKEAAPKGGASGGKATGGKAKGGRGKGGSVQAIHSKAEFEKMLKSVRGSQLVVVDFHATWCGPCKQIAPKYEAMAKERRTSPVKVDVDEAKDLSQQVAPFRRAAACTAQMAVPCAGRLHLRATCTGRPLTPARAPSCPQYKVSAMPTFKMLKGGKEVDSMQGADDGALKSKVESLAGRHDRWGSGGGRSL